MPLGFYRVFRVDRPLVHGDMVEVCPPTAIVALARERHYLYRGSCPGDVVALLKLVGAVAGDTVDVRDGAVFVNGKKLPNSRLFVRDEAGRPLPVVARGRRIVPAGSLWLYTPNPYSLDSRYYGFVPVKNVRARIALLLQTSPWPYSSDLPGPARP